MIASKKKPDAFQQALGKFYEFDLDFHALQELVDFVKHHPKRPSSPQPKARRAPRTP